MRPLFFVKFLSLAQVGICLMTMVNFLVQSLAIMDMCGIFLTEE